MTPPKRRAERRDDLVEAARRAIIEHGSGTVRLKEVAEEAGLTSGAVLYHYPNLEELLLEAHRAGMERFYEMRFKAIEHIADPAERLITTIRCGLPNSSSDPDVLLLCELGGSAGRNRVYGSLLTTLYDRQVSMYQVILESGAARGVFALESDSLTISRNLVALEDAYGYRIIARHPLIDPDKAFELILNYASHATGCDLSTY
jgi:AcrR family transcriptional regulator